MNKILNFLLALTFLASFTGCGGSDGNNIETTIQEAEMAVAQGDMISASSIAYKLSKGENLTGLTATQLGRLSLIYMQIADSLEPEENISKATEYFRKAYDIDADSASLFYSGVERDRLPHVMMLSTLVSSLDAPEFTFSNENDSIPLDSIL